MHKHFRPGISSCANLKLPEQDSHFMKWSRAWKGKGSVHCGVCHEGTGWKGLDEVTTKQGLSFESLLDSKFSISSLDRHKYGIFLIYLFL